jgi:hypothetical protein
MGKTIRSVAFWREDGDPKVECDDFERFGQNCMAVEPAGYVFRGW